MTKLKGDDVERAHAEYFESDEPVEEIARRYRVHRRTLHYRFTRANLPIRPRPSRPRVWFNNDELLDAGNRHDHGDALDDIAYDLDTSPVTLSRKLRAIGHDTSRRPRGRSRANIQGEQDHVNQRTA